MFEKKYNIKKISYINIKLRKEYFQIFKYFFLIYLLIIYIIHDKYQYKEVKIKNYLNNNKTKTMTMIKDKNLLQSYILYINSCKNLIRFNSKFKIRNGNPFLSICIPIHNSEKFIERAILSVINQSFHDFEIIIVNDFSNDNTENIIKKLIHIDYRIKYINNTKNFGIHYSRVEAVLKSKGKYILFLDSDDMILNGNLFKELFKYYLYNNLDIIEFIVYYQIEGENNIFDPKAHTLNHNHNYKSNIIYQPELRDIIFYDSKTKKYTNIICRTIWNKMIKRRLLLKTIKYIGNINKKYIF